MYEDSVIGILTGIFKFCFCSFSSIDSRLEKCSDSSQEPWLSHQSDIICREITPWFSGDSRWTERIWIREVRWQTFPTSIPCQDVSWTQLRNVTLWVQLLISDSLFTLSPNLFTPCQPYTMRILQSLEYNSTFLWLKIAFYNYMNVSICYLSN